MWKMTENHFVKIKFTMAFLTYDFQLIFKTYPDGPDLNIRFLPVN